jgi:hypothetical protein
MTQTKRSATKILSKPVLEQYEKASDQRAKKKGGTTGFQGRPPVSVSLFGTTRWLTVNRPILEGVDAARGIVCGYWQASLILFVFVYQPERLVDSACRERSLDKKDRFGYCSVDETLWPSRAWRRV